MIYVSIDIETSGLEPDKHKTLSIGAIIEDTEKKLSFEECPKFNAIVLQNDIIGSPRALTMNQNIISLMGMYLEASKEDKEKLIMMEDLQPYGYKFYEKDEVVKEFYWWLHENGFSHGLTNSGGYAQVVDGVTKPMINGATKPITLNVAGKNFGTFDKLFLQELPWWQKLIKTRQRVLDPAILMVDWKNDTSLPNLTTCKERAGVNGIVTHNALEDAWDVIEVLRKFY
jgi:DNA polymerase III epsilon subunit-like protein